MGPAARNIIDTAFSDNKELSQKFSVVERDKLNLVLKEQGPGEVQDPDQVETARTAASSLPKLPTPPMGAIIAFGVVYAFIFSFGIYYIYRVLHAGPAASLATVPAGAMPNRPMSLGEPGSFPNRHSMQAGE